LADEGVLSIVSSTYGTVVFRTTFWPGTVKGI
jgi:hypothetical protein